MNLSAVLVLALALSLSSGANAQTPMNGWWNDKPDCMGKYYRYFDFNDKIRYFIPDPKPEHMHVQPISNAGDDSYIDQQDNVEYTFNFKKETLDIHWVGKGENRTWHHCPERRVQLAYINMMRAYLVNRSYIDLANEDNSYSGEDFLLQQCILSFRDKNYQQAFNDCDFSWQSNKNGMAANYMAQMYQWGVLGEKDYIKALEWYKQSAAAGYSDSFEWLAWAYRFGKGTEVDLALARENYLTSANYGNINSSVAAARMLILGQGGDIDYDHAIKLLSHAANAKDIQAMNYLGVLYAKGLIGQGDPVKAFQLVKQAADKNDIRARYNLGWFYILGIGTEQQKDAGEKILKLLDEYSYIKLASFLCSNEVFQPSAQIERCVGDNYDIWGQSKN